VATKIINVSLVVLVTVACTARHFLCMTTMITIMIITVYVGVECALVEF